MTGRKLKPIIGWQIISQKSQANHWWPERARCRWWSSRADGFGHQKFCWHQKLWFKTPTGLGQAWWKMAASIGPVNWPAWMTCFEREVSVLKEFLEWAKAFLLVPFLRMRITRPDWPKISFKSLESERIGEWPVRPVRQLLRADKFNKAFYGAQWTGRTAINQSSAGANPWFGMVLETSGKLSSRSDASNDQRWSPFVCVLHKDFPLLSDFHSGDASFFHRIAAIRCLPLF